MTKKLIYNYFSDDDFLVISSKITEVEKSTAGEVRVAIKEKRNFRDRKTPIRELAIKEFRKLGMDNTIDGTGFLILIILEEKQFYILAGKGINEKVEQSVWDKVRDEMQSSFKNEFYLDGILTTLSKAGELLSSYFPIKEGDTNELSNKVAF
ncbi:hypothetical protein APF79_05800 [bacterium BRH_c32]|nr:MAG: hypothetical protein APF79_05800 [bacterium BRH_c32]